MHRVQAFGFCLLFLTLTCCNSILAAEPEQDEAAALKAIEGKWTRAVQTAHGVMTYTKEHQGKTSTMTVTDPAGNILHQHMSEIRVEYTGRVRTLTFFNTQVTAGPQKGQQKNAGSTYVYRITDNKFYEIYGILEADPLPFETIVWDKAK